jgi:hypothetical protein
MKSLKAFEENLKSTDMFTGRIHAMSTYLKPVSRDKYPKSISPETLDLLIFDETHFEKIFEVGFIALFANFEYFMYEFLKELYLKQPLAIPNDKTVKSEDILQFSNFKSVKEFIIDSVAIENSYDLEVWNNTVSKLFNIKPISDEVKVKIMIMNSVRNMFLHSGGHWNSKVYKDSKKIERALNATKTPSEKIAKESKRQAFKTGKTALTPEIAYTTTRKCLIDIIADIKSQIEKKNNRTKRTTA